MVWKKNLNPEDYINYLQQLISAGAKNVLLSLGQAGAIYVNQNIKLKGNAPKGKLVNTACAGDALLGTFLAGKIKENAIEKTLSRSLAAGSSTAFSQGLTDFSDVEQLEQQINVMEVI